MFYSALSPSLRYTVSTVIHLITGTTLIAGFRMIYDLFTLIAVICLDSSPLSWPPIMGRPWHADSMHSFWAKEWHQVLRHTFMIFGGYPGMWIAGPHGMVFGAFLASGLFHSCSMYSADREFDYSTVIFFASQSLLLILERLWNRVTGKRVGGWIGRLWVYFVMFVGAQAMVDSWHRHGLGGGVVIPPLLSPMRVIVLPLIRRLLDHFILSKLPSP